MSRDACHDAPCLPPCSATCWSALSPANSAALLSSSWLLTTVTCHHMPVSTTRGAITSWKCEMSLGSGRCIAEFLRTDLRPLLPAFYAVVLLVASHAASFRPPSVGVAGCCCRVHRRISSSFWNCSVVHAFVHNSTCFIMEFDNALFAFLASKLVFAMKKYVDAHSTHCCP